MDQTYYGSKKIYISYITEGRERYYYHTDIIGAFVDKNTAMKKLFQTLVDHGKILLEEVFEDDPDCGREIFKDEESFEKFKEIDRDDIEEFPFHLLDENIDLEEIIEGFSDSYYKDGWDYSIKEVEIEFPSNIKSAKRD